MLRRIMMLVAAAALMVVLVATTASPAFADRGYHGDGPYWFGHSVFGIWGWGCGNERNSAYYCDVHDKK
jgi:Spy/CpxP family protein refolding chaperone